RHRSMAACATQRDVEEIGACYAWSREDGDFAQGQVGPVVEVVDLVAREAFEQTLSDHRPRSAQSFLGRLEDEDHRATEIPRLRQIAGRAKQDGRVAVVAASMEDTRGV